MTTDELIGQEFRRWAPERPQEAPGDAGLASTLGAWARAAEASLTPRGDTPPSASERPRADEFARRDDSPYHLKRARRRAEEQEPVPAPWAA